MDNQKEITAIVLAGGKSSRMGSEKGLVLLDNKPFVEHILEAVEPLVTKTIIVSGNSSYDRYANKRVEDIVQDAGPIAGIHSGLTHSATENNIIISCDVPFVTTKLLKKLIKYTEEDFDIVQLEGKGETIPLIALYKKRCVVVCMDLLIKNERRLRKLIINAKTKTIKVSEQELFFVSNINTITDLKNVRNAINH